MDSSTRGHTGGGGRQCMTFGLCKALTCTLRGDREGFGAGG